MAKILYELANAEKQRFSPYCWRTRLALAHKGLEAEPGLVRFSDIKDICNGASKTVPVLDDGGTVVSDSWDIAVYLDDTYPDKPLFNGPAARAHCKFIENWANLNVLFAGFPMIAGDIHDRLDTADQDYFRTTREQRLGKPFAQASSDRDSRIETYRAGLMPLRMTLDSQPFIGGETPDYADYAVMGSFMTGRVMSPFQLLSEDDPIYAWRERCLDLFGGLARQEAAAA